MNTIKINGKILTFHTLTGSVVSVGKNLETRISSSGGSNSHSVSSTTIVHDQLFLIDDAGREHSFQLQDFNLACREGNSVVVIWAIKDGRAKGPYVAVINYTTGRIFFGKRGLFEAGNPNAWKLAGLFVGIVILGCTIWGWMFLPIIVLLWFSFLGFFFIKTWRNSKKIRKAIDSENFKITTNMDLKARKLTY